MRAGELRHQVTLQSPTQARNAFNEMETTWTDVATVWAAIEWRSGRRYLEAAQLNAEVQGVIRIRYRSGVQPYWRFKFGDRYISILSMTNIYERNREIQFNCKEAQD